MVFYGQTFQASESNTVIIQSSQQGQGLFWKLILMIVTPSVPKKNKASLTTYTGNIEFQRSWQTGCSATSWWETNRPFGKSKTPTAEVFWEAHSYYICCPCNFASLLVLSKKHTLKITIIANHPQTFHNHQITPCFSWKDDSVLCSFTPRTTLLRAHDDLHRVPTIAASSKYQRKYYGSSEVSLAFICISISVYDVYVLYCNYIYK